MSKVKKAVFGILSGISKCGRKEFFLPNFKKLCDKLGKTYAIHNIGDRLIPWVWENTREELSEQRILQMDPLTIDITQAAVLQETKFALKQDLKEKDVVLVNVHTTFEWRDVCLPAYNDLFIRSLIQDGMPPDMFVCCIDRGEDIVARLNESDQWSGQGLSEREVWKWQNNEVNNTKRYVFLFDDKKEFFVMPVRQPPETLYRLIFEPWRPRIYAQMPISHVTGKELKRVKRFIGQMRKWAVVFDPLTIETGLVSVADVEPDDAQISVRHNQTAHRDVHWFIPQCDICNAYYVKVVFTAGVVDETVVASQRGKEAWIIFPEDCSPFLPYRATRDIFKSPEDFLEFFEKEFMPEWIKAWEKKNGMKVPKSFLAPK